MPPAYSVWGNKLIITLIIVTLFVVLSLVRTLITLRIDACAPVFGTHRVAVFFRDAHGLSAAVLKSIVLLADTLAHG